jgi:hypothetical protein
MYPANSPKFGIFKTLNTKAYTIKSQIFKKTQLIQIGSTGINFNRCLCRLQPASIFLQSFYQFRQKLFRKQRGSPAAKIQRGLICNSHFIAAHHYFTADSINILFHSFCVSTCI